MAIYYYLYEASHDLQQLLKIYTCCISRKSSSVHGEREGVQQIMQCLLSEMFSVKSQFVLNIMT